jgi:hypothetical protein
LVLSLISSPPIGCSPGVYGFIRARAARNGERFAAGDGCSAGGVAEAGLGVVVEGGVMG